MRELLTTYPDGMPVFAEWEGVHAYVRPEMFSVMRVSKARERDACGCLVVDVNKY